MAEIKTRPATPEFRDGWDRIFGGKSRDEQRTTFGIDFSQPVLDDKTHRLPMTDSEYEYRARLARAWNEGIHA